ncbi:hypothetical protein BASA81_017660 [Batrachochytrium salamandrivorans]|nr:hypothetical protein BASA81_017660 [Batrachochytrium salamandrivorans]
MSFGFANAPPHFQWVMNSIFSDMLGKFVLVYLDDIIIYSPDPTSHVTHVRKVLDRLREKQLYCKLEKCFYGKHKLHYLGYIISSAGVEMDPKKIDAVQEWPVPTKVHDIQVFLGFTNFIGGLFRIMPRQTQPLTALLKKDIKFDWNQTTEDSFKALKKAFKDNVILTHADESQEFLVEVDASDFAVAGVLSQYNSQRDLQPVAFFSRQMVPAERNYEIYDKELLAIAVCLKEWRHFLQNSIKPFTILSDHKSLEYFMTTKQLTRRQARWAELLSEYDFRLSYRPGSHNGKADHLSRRPDYMVEEEKWLLGIPEPLLDTCRKESAHFTMADNTFCRVLENGISKIPYCPSWDRKSVYARFHRGLGHLKFDSIIDLVTRRYWWPTMKQDIKKYISECPECQLDQSASGRHAPTPIRPIPSVALPFERWGMDFVQDLPRTKSGNQHIITAIDYATRWVVAKAVPNRDSVTVASFLYELMMNYGSPFELFTDRGSSFISEGIREYEKLQRIRHHATTPYHPQTNGMVERMHATMGHAITTLTQGRPDRWDEYLQQTVFALRVRKHAVTKQSPFYLLYGVHPRLPGDDGPIKGNHGTTR